MLVLLATHVADDIAQLEARKELASHSSLKRFSGPTEGHDRETLYIMKLGCGEWRALLPVYSYALTQSIRSPCSCEIRLTTYQKLSESRSLVKLTFLPVGRRGGGT